MAVDQSGLEDFWKVYDGHFEEIEAELRGLVEEDPDFGPLLQAIPQEQAEEQSRDSRARMGKAILDGEWDSYLDNLRAQGAAYAQMGVSMGGWFRLVGLVRPKLTALLFDAFGGSSERLQTAVRGMQGFMDVALAVIGPSYLQAKERTIREQQEAIRELSTPALLVRDGLLLLPIVGVLDSDRARQMTDHLLRAISLERARVVVIDITGVAAVDSMVANHLVQTVQAVGLLGAEAIVTGVSAEVAQTIVRIGVDLGRIRTMGRLQSGIEEADRLLAGHTRRSAERT